MVSIRTLTVTTTPPLPGVVMRVLPPKSYAPQAMHSKSRTSCGGKAFYKTRPCALARWHLLRSSLTESPLLLHRLKPLRVCLASMIHPRAFLLSFGLDCCCCPLVPSKTVSPRIRITLLVLRGKALCGLWLPWHRSAVRLFLCCRCFFVTRCLSGSLLGAAGPPAAPFCRVSRFVLACRCCRCQVTFPSTLDMFEFCSPSLQSILKVTWTLKGKGGRQLQCYSLHLGRIFDYNTPALLAGGKGTVLRPSECCVDNISCCEISARFSCPSFYGAVPCSCPLRRVAAIGSSSLP